MQKFSFGFIWALGSPIYFMIHCMYYAHPRNSWSPWSIPPFPNPLSVKLAVYPLNIIPDMASFVTNAGPKGQKASMALPRSHCLPLRLICQSLALTSWATVYPTTWFIASDSCGANTFEAWTKLQLNITALIFFSYHFISLFSNKSQIFTHHGNSGHVIAIFHF